MKILLKVMMTLFSLSGSVLCGKAVGNELSVDYLGGLGAFSAPSNAFIYKVCVDNYEYVVIHSGNNGSISIVQSYERVVDNQGRVISLPKMCSSKNGICSED